MTTKQAIKKIVDNYDELLKKQDFSGSAPETEAVWFHITNHSVPYEIDEEWLGVRLDGKIVWAYASGCSCWDGDFEVKVCETKSMKEFTFEHKDMKAEWEQKLIEFAQSIK